MVTDFLYSKERIHDVPSWIGDSNVRHVTVEELLAKNASKHKGLKVLLEQIYIYLHFENLYVLD